MKSRERAKHFKSLNAELSSRNQDEGTQTIHRRPPLLVKSLNDWNQVSKGLSTTRASTADHVSAADRVRNTSSLYFSHLDELRFVKSLDRAARDGQIAEPNLDLSLVI